LAELVHEQRSAVSQGGVREPLLLAGGQTIPTALAMIFAGAADGIPVLLADPAGPAPTPVAVPDGTFLIVVTSGTSGRPRPVLRTAESWTASFAPLTELAGLSPDDRVLLTGPLHATLHLFAAVHTLAMGAELTQWPERATAVHAVPAVLSDLITTLPATAPMRTAVVAGSTLSTEIGDRALARGITVSEYYGAAELSFVAARRYPAPLRPFSGAEVDIRPAVTATESELRGSSGKAGSPGTLWVRSPYLAIGYPAGVDGPLRRDDNGYATVGDLANRNDDGGLTIRGRGDAAITTGGATVIAEDIESALSRLPGVGAVAVIGLPHRRYGEVVTAVIEPATDAELTELRGAARELLRGPSLPRRWLIADRLPRTPGGKIARDLVRQAAAAHANGERWVGPPALRPLA
jgi:acyl-CoA synthetase (AMP-forming)/AMP-acid ligase II